MSVVEELAERIGPRPAGSAAEREAGLLISRLAEEAGASLQRHPFVFRGWRSGGHASLRLGEEGIEFLGDALPYTVATPPGGSRGTLREVGEWPLLPGRVYCKRFVLEDQGARPLAAVMACPYEDVRALPNPQPLASMPTLVVGRKEGERLSELLANGRAGTVAAHLEIASQWEGLLSGENVIADVGPSGAPQLLIVAHMDTVPQSPGANDNAAGVAAALGILNGLQDSRLAFGMRFVFAAAEEPFLVGSRAYAGQLVASGEIRRVVGCLNLDMVAVGDRFVIRVPEDEGWQRAARELTESPPNGMPIDIAESLPTSDHWSFHEVGIASAQLTRMSDAAWHGRLDTASRVTGVALDEATTTASELVERYMERRL